MKFYAGKLFLFISLMALIQYFAADRPKQLQALADFAANETAVLYFGDSVINHRNEADLDRRTLAEMVDDQLPQSRVGNMSHAAYHSAIYADYVYYLERMDYQPELIIIPINLRSFSPEWDLKPAYQFEQEQIFLRKPPLAASFYTFLTAVQFPWQLDAPTISQSTYENNPVYLDETAVGIVKEFDNNSYHTYSDENLRQKLIFHYLYNLTSDHRKVIALQELAATANAQGIAIIFYITPIDFQTGEREYPEQFKQITSTNIAIILAALEPYNVTTLNLAYRLDSDAFSYEIYPNEHLNEKGRQAVAAAVVAAAEPLLTPIQPD